MEALHDYTETLEIAKKTGDKSIIANRYNQLGLFCWRQGQLENAK